MIKYNRIVILKGKFIFLKVGFVNMKINIVRILLYSIRVLLNLIIFIPLILISISYFSFIDKHLMANLLGIIIFILIVPFFNIAIELIICKARSRLSKTSVAIIIANIMIFLLDYNVVVLIGKKF